MQLANVPTDPSSVTMDPLTQDDTSTGDNTFISPIQTLGVDLESIQRNNALCILKLKDIHHVSQATVDFVASETHSMLEHQRLMLQAAVRASQESSEVSENLLSNVKKAFEIKTVTFQGLDTAYLQEKYFKEKFHMILSCLCICSVYKPT